MWPVEMSIFHQSNFRGYSCDYFSVIMSRDVKVWYHLILICNPTKTGGYSLRGSCIMNDIWSRTGSFERTYFLNDPLQSASGIIKCDRLLLQSVSGITKCDRLLLQSASSITKCDSYYKVRRNSWIHFLFWYVVRTFIANM